MFKPVSALPYRVLDADRQLLVCSFNQPENNVALQNKWHSRACAIFHFSLEADVCDVVRDLLANPQIRAVVFEGESLARTWFDEFWKRESPAPWGIKEEHLELVRQFVDLFDGDCGINRALPPFWPERLRYEAPKENKAK